MTTDGAAGLLETDVLDDVRESLARVMTDPDTDVDASLREMGWDEVFALDPIATAAALFAAQGRALRQSNALGAVMLAQLEGVLPATEAVRVLAIPFAGGTLLPFAPAPSTEVVVPVTTEAGVELAIVTEVDAIEVNGFDISGQWFQVQPESTAVAIDPGAAWAIAVARGRVALADEILGCCETALTAAVEHVSTRKQYGREIGRFQGVRHRLGESYAALEAGRELVAAARRAETPAAAALAKFQAGRVQSLVLRHTMHVLGAMGITLEGSMHRHVTRAAVLDLLLGGHVDLANEIGDGVLTSDALDTLVDV